MNKHQLKITQIKSKNGRLDRHKKCLLGLGLKRINQSVIIEDTIDNRGMINKINYMLKVEELNHVS